MLGRLVGAASPYPGRAGGGDYCGGRTRPALAKPCALLSVLRLEKKPDRSADHLLWIHGHLDPRRIPCVAISPARLDGIHLRSPGNRRRHYRNLGVEAFAHAASL